MISKKGVVLLALGVVGVLGIGTFVYAVRWAREIREDSLWAGISPDYVGAAIQEKEHETPWRGIPFCSRLEWRGSQAILTEDPRCKPLKDVFGQSGFCGVQNLNEDPKLGALSAGAAQQLSQRLADYVTEKKCETLVLDLEKTFTEVVTRSVVQNLKKALPSLQLAWMIRAPREEQLGDGKSFKQSVQIFCDAGAQLVLLAYDDHVPGKTSKGEMAPLNWVRESLTRALEVCPADRIRLGIAAYGYDWKTGAFLPENQVGFPQVNDDFIETTRKRALKFNLAHELGVHQFFLWALGMEH